MFDYEYAETEPEARARMHRQDEADALWIALIGEKDALHKKHLDAANARISELEAQVAEMQPVWVALKRLDRYVSATNVVLLAMRTRGKMRVGYSIAMVDEQAKDTIHDALVALAQMVEGDDHA
ncbi:MAG: hypothetical protein ACOYD4_11780 [Solirubrobacterales bacterium]